MTDWYPLFSEFRFIVSCHLLIPCYIPFHLSSCTQKLRCTLLLVQDVLFRLQSIRRIFCRGAFPGNLQYCNLLRYVSRTVPLLRTVLTVEETDCLTQFETARSVVRICP